MKFKKKHSILENEQAAGFPPCTRGNKADGYLLQLPKINSKSNALYALSYPNDHYEKIAEILLKIKDDKCKQPQILIQISTDIPIDFIAWIRGLRTAWSYLFIRESKVPTLYIEVETSFGYHPSLLKIICSEVDGIVSENLSDEILKQFMSDFRIGKTIDPFGGSTYIEEKTKKITEEILSNIYQ